MKYLSILTKLMAVALVISFIPVRPAQAFEQLPRSLRWELVDQNGTSQQTHVNSVGYSYGVIYAQPGETVNLSLTVANRSTNPRGQVWYGASDILSEGPGYPNAHAIGVGTWDPMDHIPSFLDPSSFVINNNRFAYYEGPAIYRDGRMGVYFNVKIKDSTPSGVYDLVVSLVREFDEWGYRVNPNGTNHRYRGVLWKFVIGDAIYLDPGVQWKQFTNIRHGYAFNYPDVKIVGGYPVVMSNHYDVYNPSLAASISVNGRIWGEYGLSIGTGYELDCGDYRNMSPQEAAKHIWNCQKADSNPNLTKTISELRSRVLAGQATYEFDVATYFNPGSSLADRHEAYTFFKSSDGTTFNVQWRVGDSISERIVDSIRLY